MDDPTIKAYDRIAEEYERANANSMWVSHLQEFKEAVPSGRILEIGCGSGRDAASFADENYEYVGIDASEKMIKMARKKLPNADFRIMNFYELQFQPSGFDGFLAIASLLHAPKNRIEEILNSVGNIVKPRGIGMITMRKGEGEGWREKQGTLRYFAFYKSDEFRQVLEKSSHSVLHSGEAKEPDGTEWLYFFTRRS